jgi:hypothetical protein
MGSKENLQYLRIGYQVWIKGELYDLGVPGGTAANCLVGWLGHRATGISGNHRFHALQFNKYGLQTPKTPTPQRRLLLSPAAAVTIHFLRHSVKSILSY